MRIIGLHIIHTHSFPIESQWYAGLAYFPRMQMEEGIKPGRLIANPSLGQHTVSTTFTHLCRVFDSSALCLSNYTQKRKIETLIYLALLFTYYIMHHPPAQHNRGEIHTSVCYVPENLGGEGSNKMMQERKREMRKTDMWTNQEYISVPAAKQKCNMASCGVQLW